MEGGLPDDGAVRRVGDRAVRETAPWVEKLARAGYAAKGVVYVMVGGLAVAAAAGRGGGATTDSTGALATLSDSPLGRTALGLVAAGLIGYAIWGVVRAVLNPEREGAGRRAFAGVTGLVYAGLALEAGRMALSGGGAGESNGAAHWSAQLMGQPFGLWLVGLVGAAIAGYGVQQLINAWRVDLDDQLDMSAMSRTTRRVAVRTGRFGLAARGLVFSIIGYYFVRSALEADPSEARGLDAVLDAMRDAPWVLGIVALGLVAYGVYCLIRARYRVIRPA